MSAAVILALVLVGLLPLSGHVAAATTFSRNLFVKSHVDTVSDHFSRTTTDGWGEAEVGGAYTPTANAPSFSVNG